MIKLMQTIRHLLEEGEDVVLATLIRHVGSTPRAAGAKMVIRANGAIVGTIGGGLVEFEVQKIAREVFKTGKAILKTVELSGADAATTDQMICGGQLEILLELITADPGSLNDVEELIAALQRGHKGFFIKSLDTEGDAARRMACCLVQKDAVVLGRFPGTESWISILTGEASREKCPVAVTVEGKRFFIEPTFLPGTVYLFGAGHVSRPVAELSALVDFQVAVLDDRSEFANLERFPKADMIKVIPSFDRSFDGLEIDRDSYLVIVTRGHLHDKTVLEQALGTPAGYIGMIGSKRKRNLVYRELLEKGFSNGDIERVHAPIGLDIAAETPEEIAVSIVAELIKARAELGR
jgi:xanthine dehydrogenase accessory factor